MFSLTNLPKGGKRLSNFDGKRFKLEQLQIWMNADKIYTKVFLIKISFAIFDRYASLSNLARRISYVQCN